MSMTINPVSRFDNEQQRADATRFVNKNDRQITKMATKIYDEEYHESNKKFAKKLSTALNVVPLIAVGAGLASGKGTKASLKQGAEWGLALLAANTVGKLNKKAVESSPKLEKAEKHNAGLSFIAQSVAAVGAYFGASALFNKALDNKHVKAVGNSVVEGVKTTLESIKKNVKVSPEYTEKFAKLKENVKMPEALKSFAGKINASKATSVTQKVVKKTIEKAPMLTVLGMAGALIGKSIQQANDYSVIRSGLKQDQLNTARNLVNSYKQENDELKAAMNTEKSENSDDAE